MMRKLKYLFWIVFCSTAVCSSNAFAQEVQPPRTPAPVEALVYVRPFTLSEGYQWSTIFDKSETDSGVIVVLRVDPELVIPRNGPGPILYVGDRMLQALNFGHTSGHVIGLIPGEIDLSKTPIWFGSAISSGHVTQDSIQAELSRAEGIRPFSAEEIESETRPTVEAPNLEALLRGELADLVLEYAPEEGHLARKWRLPEAKAKPDSLRDGAVGPLRQKR